MNSLGGNLLEHATLETLMSMNAGVMPDDVPCSIFTTSPLASQYGLDTVTCGILGGTINSPAFLPFFTGNPTHFLHSSLYFANGTALQYTDRTHTQRIKTFDGNKPNHPIYSTSTNLAGMCFTKALATVQDKDHMTQLELEQWARTNLFEPLGFPTKIWHL